jgi:choline monooxygenase
VDQLGELVGETARYAATAAVLCERREYLVECNWKVYVDNYLEGYHIPPVHPALLRELDYPAYRVEPRDHHSRQYAPIRPLPAGSAGERSGAEREYSPTEGDGAAAYYWVFPNLMLNYYPDHLQINIVQPLAVDRTLVVFEWYFAERLSEEQKHRQLRRIAFSDTVQQEDAAICQAVQERLRAGVYDRGRFVPGHEDGVHHFQRLLLRYLQGG